MLAGLLLALSGAGMDVRAGTENVAGGKQIGANVWFQNLSGSLSGRTGAGSAVATISGSGSPAPGFALTLKTIGSLAVDVSYTPISVDTAFTADMAFSFAGVNFGTQASGRLSYRMPIYEGDLRWIMLDNRWGRVCLSGVLKLVRPDLIVVSGTNSQELAMTVPIPMAGISGQVNVTKAFKVYGSLKMLDLPLVSVRTRVSDWDLGAIFDWHAALRGKGVRLAGGYRRLALDLTTAAGTGAEAGFDIRHQGPYFELGTSF